jgi:hypothetical protein
MERWMELSNRNRRNPNVRRKNGASIVGRMIDGRLNLANLSLEYEEPARFKVPTLDELHKASVLKARAESYRNKEF